MSSSKKFRLFSALAVGLGLAVAPMTASYAGSHRATAHGAALHGFKTIAEAKAGCGGDAVVWRARGSKVFHLAGSKYFGKTRHGTFVCQKAAEAKGLHAARS
ncbi:MAG: hypothetical protein KGL52_04045 [Rhodospirillales bacterium]|jgi:hypothetical protein|nr:hypothetical protein [Rhodospirillales bacterium]